MTRIDPKTVAQAVEAGGKPGDVAQFVPRSRLVHALGAYSGTGRGTVAISLCGDAGPCARAGDYVSVSCPKCIAKLTEPEPTMEPKIRFIRDEVNTHDFRVLINGEHRATFRSNKRFGGAGYGLYAPDGISVHTTTSRITQVDFETVVRDALEQHDPRKTIPTRAEIDRALMIARAQVENQDWQRAADMARFQLRQEVLRVALARYIGDAPDAAHAEMAARLLEQAARGG